MHQFLEAAAIALQAIWANKLRSLLTVLGNIVAVTSIIAVVSLVQGLNASVKDVDPVAVRGRRVRRVAHAARAHRRGAACALQSNPRVTLEDADGHPRRSAAAIGLVMAEAQRERAGQVPRPSRSTASRSAA